MISVTDVLALAFGFVFMAWPLLLLAPLQNPRRKNLLLGMLIIWGFLAVMRAFIFFTPYPIPSFFISEPLNTIFFIGVGAVLLALKVGLNFWHRRQIQKRTENIHTIQQLLELSPTQFEEMIVEIYRSFGHEAKRTGTQGDHGIDVVVQTKKGAKLVIQCKRWRGNVGEPIIRDFYGAMHHEKADKGVIITTGNFTPQAQAWAKGKPLLLYNGEKLLEILERMKTPKQVGSEMSDEVLPLIPPSSKPENTNNQPPTEVLSVEPVTNISPSSGPEITDIYVLGEQIKEARKNKDLGRAEQLARRMMQIDQRTDKGAAILCSVLREKGLPEQALAETEIYKNSKNTALLNSRAAALCDLGQWEEAKKVVGRSLALEQSPEAFKIVNRIKATRPDLYQS